MLCKCELQTEPAQPCVGGKHFSQLLKRCPKIIRAADACSLSVPRLGFFPLSAGIHYFRRGCETRLALVVAPGSRRRQRVKMMLRVGLGWLYETRTHLINHIRNVLFWNCEYIPCLFFFVFFCLAALNVSTQLRRGFKVYQMNLLKTPQIRFILFLKSPFIVSNVVIREQHVKYQY